MIFIQESSNRILCNLYSNHVISVVQGQRVRLVDDGFAKICNLVNDISATVRTKACRLLGSMRNVRWVSFGFGENQLLVLMRLCPIQDFFHESNAQ